MWKALRTMMKPVFAPPPPIQPFGPDFGLTILPEFIRDLEVDEIRKQYVDIALRKSGEAVLSDGRIQLPPLNPYSFEAVLNRLYEDNYVLPGWLNNQTVNLYEEGYFIRAHVDNLFVYDDTFAILSIGSPTKLKLVHMQNGEQLEALIPDRSVYILEGPARYVYLHMIPPCEDLRVSLVLRKSIFNSSGCFTDVPNPQTRKLMPYRSNSILNTLMSKEIGTPRIPVDEKWMEENNLGMFDTARMVQQLRPMRDWSLRQQLDEDHERYLELKHKGYLETDLEWRFEELRKQFRVIEEEITVNSSAFSRAAEESAKAQEKEAREEAEKRAEVARQRKEAAAQGRTYTEDAKAQPGACGSGSCGHKH